MKVRLLKDIHGRGTGLIRQSPRRFPTGKDQLQPDGSTRLVPIREGREPQFWVKGTVIEMSEASARKFIDRGDAEPIEEQQHEPSTTKGGEGRGKKGG